MLFSRTYRYRTAMPIETIKSRLLGQHVKVHNLDFEVFEKDRMIKIIPHAEQIENIKTLPITHVEFLGQGDKTKLVISSKMRKIDKGGPLIIVIFCLAMIIAGLTFSLVGQGSMQTYTYSMLGIGLLVFVIFWWRMESGYFDYVRKIRDYVKKESVA